MNLGKISDDKKCDGFGLQVFDEYDDGIGAWSDPGDTDYYEDDGEYYESNDYGW